MQLKSKLPFTDRFILFYDNIFYIILVAKYATGSDICCPITMFMPTKEYLKEIDQLNKVYKVQNL